jgi:radical SAM protein (TIGR04043 family)
MGELADKKMEIQSRGVKIDWRLEEELSSTCIGAESDYMSFFMDDVPVGVLNGFYTDSSPFEIRSINGGTSLFKDGELFTDVSFLDRPPFYDLKTKKGKSMEKLCKMVTPGFPIVYMNRGCMYWGVDQCRFCVVGHIDTEAKKDPYEVAEVVSAGVKEGSIRTHVALTSGALSNDEGIKILGRTTDAIKELTEIPVSVNAEPPRDLGNLKLLSNADSVYFNLEVYDKKLRKDILPGKSEFSVEYYDQVFEECFQYFEENQVGSVLLAGLEDSSSYLKGIEHLADKGVMPVPVPFYPTFHSKLEDVSPPDDNKMKKIYSETANIVTNHGLNPFRTQAGFMKGGAIFALKEVMEGV